MSTPTPTSPVSPASATSRRGSPTSSAVFRRTSRWPRRTGRTRNSGTTRSTRTPSSPMFRRRCAGCGQTPRRLSANPSPSRGGPRVSTRRAHPMTDRTRQAARGEDGRRERLEVPAWLLFAVSLGAMEGGVVSVMVKALYRQAVGAVTLDYAVAVLVGAPLFAGITCLGWAAVGLRGRSSRLLVNLQVLCVACLLLLAAAPRNAAGLAMVLTGAVSARLLWSGVLTLRTSVWRLRYDREQRAGLAGRVVAAHYLAIAVTGISVGALVDSRPAALPGLYLLIAGLGLAGAFLYRSDR